MDSCHRIEELTAAVKSMQEAVASMKNALDKKSKTPTLSTQPVVFFSDSGFSDSTGHYPRAGWYVQGSPLSFGTWGPVVSCAAAYKVLAILTERRLSMDSVREMDRALLSLIEEGRSTNPITKEG